MTTEPGQWNECRCIGTVADRYKHTGIPFQEIRSMEELLPRAGIHHFGRFRCGYHIRTEQSAVMYQDLRGSEYGQQLCALDWYCQSPSDRLSEPDTWDHYLLLHQVSPMK